MTKWKFGNLAGVQDIFDCYVSRAESCSVPVFIFLNGLYHGITVPHFELHLIKNEVYSTKQMKPEPADEKKIHARGENSGAGLNGSDPKERFLRFEVLDFRGVVEFSFQKRG